MRTYEGTIEIDLAEFWQWVGKTYPPNPDDYLTYGVPRVNFSNSTMEIDFAAGYQSEPEQWAVKPKAVTQWDNLREASLSSASEDN